jgi:hypothetical protein
MQTNPMFNSGTNFPTLPFNILSNIRILSVKLMETGGYNDQFVRPYVTDLTERTMNTFSNFMDLSSPVTPESINAAGKEFITLSTNVDHVAKIGGGWQAKRLRAQIEVATTDNQGIETVEQVTAYSDIFDIQGNHISPSTAFTVANVTTLRRRTITPANSQPYTSYQVANSTMLLSNTAGSTDYENAIHRMRPADLIAGISAAPYQDLADQAYDTRSRMVNGVSGSAIQNNRPDTFASRLLDAYRMSSNHQVNNYNGIGDENEFVVHDRAAKALEQTDGLLTSDPFLSAIARTTGKLAGGTFRWADLLMLDKTIPERTDLMKAKNPQQFGCGIGHESEYLYGTGPETIAAQILANAIPTILIENGLTACSIFASNRITITGEFKVAVTNARSYQYMDLTRNCKAIEDVLRTQTMIYLSNNNLMDIEIEGTFDIGADSFVSITVGGGVKTPFIIPAFCVPLITPMITTNASIFNNNVTNFTKLTSFFDINNFGDSELYNGDIDARIAHQNGFSQPQPASFFNNLPGLSSL